MKPDEARSPKKIEPVPALNRTAAKANQLLICRETRGSVARALSPLQDDGFDDSLSVGGNPDGRISAKIIRLHLYDLGNLKAHNLIWVKRR